MCESLEQGVRKRLVQLAPHAETRDLTWSGLCWRRQRQRPQAVDSAVRDRSSASYTGACCCLWEKKNDFKYKITTILHDQSRTSAMGVKVVHAVRRNATAAQNVRQHGGTLDVLDHQRNHLGQFGLAERVRQRTGPVDVVDGRMGVLVVLQLDVLHGEHRQVVRPRRVASVFHVSVGAKNIR